MKEVKGTGTGALVYENQIMLRKAINSIGQPDPEEFRLKVIKNGPHGYVYRNQKRFLETIGMVSRDEDTGDYKEEAALYEMLNHGKESHTTVNQRILLANLMALGRESPRDEAASCDVPLEQAKGGDESCLTYNQAVIIHAIRAKNANKFKHLDPLHPLHEGFSCTIL